MDAFSAGPNSNQPEFCRPEAYAYYCQHYLRIHTTEGLVRCAVAASMHAIDDLKPEWVDREITALAAAVREQCPSGSPQALISHLHNILFHCHRYHGCSEEHYYHPRNSYLYMVLQPPSRRRAPPYVPSSRG